MLARHGRVCVQAPPPPERDTEWRAVNSANNKRIQLTWRKFNSQHVIERGKVVSCGIVLESDEQANQQVKEAGNPRIWKKVKKT